MILAELDLVLQGRAAAAIVAPRAQCGHAASTRERLRIGGSAASGRHDRRICERYARWFDPACQRAVRHDRRWAREVRPEAWTVGIELLRQLGDAGVPGGILPAGRGVGFPGLGPCGQAPTGIDRKVLRPAPRTWNRRNGTRDAGIRLTPSLPRPAAEHEPGGTLRLAAA
jgi:hypothetical protein